MKPNSIQSQLDEIIAGNCLLSLDIHDEGGDTIGTLQPITLQHLAQVDVIQKLTDWRNANMGSFLSQFYATPERTRHWIENVLCKTPGQMLFLVHVGNQLVGHFGFKNLTDGDVLLDNALRGERIGHPKLFAFAGKTLVNWLWQSTNVQRIYGYVMTDNVSSIMMNKQIGFDGWIRLPLSKGSRGSEILWEIGVEGTESQDQRYCFEIFINRPQF